MNFRNITTILVIVLLGSITLLQTSCTKKPKGTMNVKGKIMDSCLNGKPFAHKNLVVSILVGGSSANIASHDSIGLGETDANGNFNIVCQNWGRGFISISSSTYGRIVYRYEIGNESSSKSALEGSVFNLETICIHP